ncbi:MAG: 50S ribosomal protein L24 [Candidatus Sumerlaeota bacterium]|nr:50S ribosomal protein L24 [Candidatus Sumerlaeota bacterium]
MSLQIKKGDRVRVRTGRDKGRLERVLGVRRDARGRVVKVLVEHVNLVRRHQRAKGRQQQGGIQEKEAYIDVSNVMLVDPKNNLSTRFGVGEGAEGKKVRISRKSGSPV